MTRRVNLIPLRIVKTADLRNLLQRFLTHVYADPRDRNRRWMGRVKRDIQTLCETSALFDLKKHNQRQEYPIVSAPSLRALWRNGHLHVSIGSPQVTTWMAQLKDFLDQWYPKQFPTPDLKAGTEWWLPVKHYRIKLVAGVSESQKVRYGSTKVSSNVARLTRNVLSSKVFAHLRICYVVGWPDIFWFAIANLLETFASDFIRCTECRKLFLKTKRQGYCSSGCRITRWRRENPLRLYEIRHRAYTSDVHDKLPGAKVQRRGPRLKHSKGG